MSGPTVARLSTTPVKGLLQSHPDTIELTHAGVVGDRVLYLADDRGRLQSCTLNPGLYALTAHLDDDHERLRVTRGDEELISATIEPGEPVETDMWGLRTITSDVVADPAWGEFFSEVVGRRVRLLRARGSAYDVHPVTLVGSASVAELARRAELESVDARRFRMLLELDGTEPHDEDTWAGRLLSVGDAVVRVGGPVQRCAAVTRHPDTGEVDQQTLRMITAYRGRQDSIFGMGANFGVYAEVVEPGRISVGDPVVVGA